MKKFSVLAAVLLFVGAMSFTSCKKTCVCKTKVGGVELGSVEKETTKSCSSLDENTTAAGVTTELTCSKK